MEIPDRLLCLFSGTVEREDDRYVVSIPARELDQGSLRAGDTYRVAILPTSGDRTETSDDAAERDTTGAPSPPVAEGDTRDVEIDDIGEQGDGIARVERGFVVIVPETDQGERVTVEITDVRENVAFADVVERLSYYD